MSKPCPFCGTPLRSDLANQCFQCGARWTLGEPGGNPPASSHADVASRATEMPRLPRSLPPEAETLGRLLSYTTNLYSPKEFLVRHTVTLSILIGLCYWSLTFAGSRHELAAFGVIGILIFVFLLLLHLRDMTASLRGWASNSIQLIYDEGMAELGRFQTRILRWDQVAIISLEHSISVQHGVRKLCTKDGAEFLMRPHEKMDQVESTIVNNLLPTLCDRFKEGRTVPFHSRVPTAYGGSELLLARDKVGLRGGRNRLTWHAWNRVVISYKSMKGAVLHHLTPSGFETEELALDALHEQAFDLKIEGQSNTFMGSYRHIENFELLLALLRVLREDGEFVGILVQEVDRAELQ